MDETGKLPHSLRLDGRSKLTMTGATEVVRFDDDQAQLVTAAGTVTVLGEGLSLRCLSLEDGTVVIQGTISGFFYEEPARKRRFGR